MQVQPCPIASFSHTCEAWFIDLISHKVSNTPDLNLPSYPEICEMWFLHRDTQSIAALSTARMYSGTSTWCFHLHLPNRIPFPTWNLPMRLSWNLSNASGGRAAIQFTTLGIVRAKDLARLHEERAQDSFCAHARDSQWTDILVLLWYINMYVWYMEGEADRSRGWGVLKRVPMDVHSAVGIACCTIGLADIAVISGSSWFFNLIPPCNA